MATQKKKKLPKPPKPPKNKTDAAAKAYAKKIDDYAKKCALIKKMNDSDSKAKLEIEKLKMKAKSIRDKCATGK